MKQQGMALIVALVITLIIGIIAVAIGRSALQNQQSASSQYDMLRSYTAAQSAGLTHQCLYFEQPHTFEQILFIQTAEPALVGHA